MHTPHNHGRPPQRRRRQGNRRRGQEGRGNLFNAVPGPCHHGADELHRQALRRQGGGLGAIAELRSLLGGVVGGLRPAARQARSLPPRPRRRLLPPPPPPPLPPPARRPHQKLPHPP